MKPDGKKPPCGFNSLGRHGAGQPADGGPAGGRKVVQFNWRRHWKKKVAPHLDEFLVQASLDRGLPLPAPHGRGGAPPHLLGRETGRRAVPGKLSWYQVCGRCHWIAFFSMAIGVLNYP